MASCNLVDQETIQNDVLLNEKFISISADKLVKEFTKDSTAASEKYIGKYLEVKGTVSVAEQIGLSSDGINDSLPKPIKWVLKRLISDLSSGNVVFKTKKSELTDDLSIYVLNATFPEKDGKAVKAIEKGAKIKVRGRLETIRQVRLNSKTKAPHIYSNIISLQGCTLKE